MPTATKYSPVTCALDMGKLLRARRETLGCTQVDIAEMMGVSPRLIGEIERGRGTVAFQTIIDYATGLGMDLWTTTRGSQQ